jgi:hypothetical protein
MGDDLFYFTITDAARFLGKSPVTLRQWERKKLVTIPRESEGGDRRLSSLEVRELAYTAYNLRRISKSRLHLVIMATETLELIERTNNESRIDRQSR